MMTPDKEQWTADIMSAAKDCTDAPVNAWLHTRILARIDAGQRTPAAAPLPPKWVLAAAAGFCMLVMVNILGMTRSRPADGPARTDGAGRVVQEYGMNEQVY